MSQVITGAKVALFINNVPVAYASNVSFNYTLNTYDVRGIDSIEVDEIAELGTEIEFTCSHFRINFNSARAFGWQPTIRDLLKQPDLTATIFDKTIKSKVTAGISISGKGATILTLQGLKLVGRSGSIDARGAYIEQLTFKAKLMYDEVGQA